MRRRPSTTCGGRWLRFFALGGRPGWTVAGRPCSVRRSPPGVYLLTGTWRYPVFARFRILVEGGQRLLPQASWTSSDAVAPVLVPDKRIRELLNRRLSF